MVAPGLTPDSIQQNMVASTWITPGCVQFLENKKRFHTAWVNRYRNAPSAISPLSPRMATELRTSLMSQRQHRLAGGIDAVRFFRPYLGVKDETT
jgi:hypothetical protein